MLLRIPQLLLLACCAGGVFAQEDGARRTCRIGRIEAENAPLLDGILTDECWRAAPAIGELVMVEPWLGRKPTERTIVKLLHDRRNLYISIWCEQDPSTVRNSQRVRDARLDPDDRIELMFDPFENRRTAYFFQVGAGGSLGDALVSANGSRFSKPWDAIWQAQARKTDDGWSCEIAIPFRSIPRKKGARSWGFNLKRYLRDRNEEYQWANPSQAVPFFRISEFGTVDGIGDVDGGIGLEVVPYVAAGLSRDRTASDDGWEFDPDMGGEIYYRVTPSMTFATTLLTDFAQTESDSRQINLNRFPLFFPEKRDFFLDGESYYNFGSQSAGGTRFLPYFSRRIGLSGGNPVPILWGMKMQGEVGPFEVGLLDAQVDGTSTTAEENLAVARVKYALGEQTFVGLISTNGNPVSTGANTVAGIDFYHRIPEFVGDMDLQISIDALGSTGEAANDDGESFGVDLQARGQVWSVQTGTRWVSNDFSPALGFVSRRGIRQSELEVGFRPRAAEGSVIRRYVFEVTGRRAEEWEGAPQSVSWQIDQLGLEFQNGDEVSLFFSRRFERVDTQFELFDNTTPVFVGDYWQTRSGFRYEANEGRPVSGNASVFYGDFWDGHSTSLRGDVDWRASPLLQMGVGYRSTIADLGPGREFTTQIGSGTLDLFFSPELSLRNLLQYDNESNGIGWQSRLRWIYSPGCDFFLVFGSNWQRSRDPLTREASIVPTEQALNFKVAHTVRF
tara:strand:+ start:144545 stop:146737 length:2193 start_codon:yes stop_codon:yes gene_type:complete